jgi:predicted CXXCH cytochrome family protein
VPDYEQQYTIYRTNHFLPQRAVPTDVTISVTGEELSPDTYRMDAEVAIEPDGVGKTMRIFMVQVLDHWPSDPTYSRNTFKQAGDYEDITLAPGESQSVKVDFTLDADSLADVNNVKIIAWAQTPEDTGPAEVYQAAMRFWPLVPGPDDFDGDGVEDDVDNCPYRNNPLQEDADEDGLGDECDNCVNVINVDQADGDEDSFGDACDNCPVLHHLNQDDTDLDSVGDPCDSCPEVPAPAGVDPFGRSKGTIDLDCDVDLDDYLLFANCISGPDETEMPPACTVDDFSHADTDDDADVDLGDASIFELNFTGPLVSPPIYVGVDFCIECHTEQHSLWITTIHSTAFDTLIEEGEGDNDLCFPCHSVGYGQPSGFVDLETTPHLADIQCENCHGPGSNHVADPENAHLDVNLDSSMCGACHQSCHGLCGENHHPQFEQWSESMHSQALADLYGQPDLVDECLQCHSADYRFAPVDAKPAWYEAMYSVECAVCHNPHGSENVGQLRLPPYQLCADCHHMEGATPPDTPPQTQTEMLHGTGAYELDGSPLVAPYTEHWWGIPDECAVCHVHEETATPEYPVNSGHLFIANMRACEPCHSEETATMLVALAREEVEIRLAAIAPYLDPSDPLYVDPSTLDPAQLAQYYNAKFNYEFVVEDKSYGSHNAYYTCALLREAEIFFGLEPWNCQPRSERSGWLLGGDRVKEYRMKHPEVRQ